MVPIGEWCRNPSTRLINRNIRYEITTGIWFTAFLAIGFWWFWLEYPVCGFGPHRKLQLFRLQIWKWRFLVVQSSLQRSDSRNNLIINMYLSVRSRTLKLLNESMVSYLQSFETKVQPLSLEGAVSFKSQTVFRRCRDLSEPHFSAFIVNGKPCGTVSLSTMCSRGTHTRQTVVLVRVFLVDSVDQAVALPPLF